MSLNQGVMRIGEVHAELRKDFPDIELSKIRYYEDKGLVQPSRSRKGYRLYSERDLACLREAIRLANEEFVPLRVVRLRLIEQGLLADTPVTPSTRQAAREAKMRVVSMPAPGTAPENETVRPALSVVTATKEADEVTPTPTSDPSGSYTSSEFLFVTGLDARVLNQLQALGLITPTTVAKQTTYTDDDVRVANVAASLVARGIDARLLGSLRRLAEREIGLIDELTQPLRAKGSGVSEVKARAITSEVAAEVDTLREVLLARALRDYLGS
ncbi:MAG TPA: MerR family transcriptional regulator [Acidimicrobiales bacterium]|nr:MerR family transcriptional regulator [Acidimicrobiales bacterium]